MSRRIPQRRNDFVNVSQSLIDFRAKEGEGGEEQRKGKEEERKNARPQTQAPDPLAQNVSSLHELAHDSLRKEGEKEAIRAQRMSRIRSRV